MKRQTDKKKDQNGDEKDKSLKKVSIEIKKCKKG